MGTVHIPTLLEGILEATAAEAAAKARITTLRATLEAEGRRRLAVEGAAPAWKAAQLGTVRLDEATPWAATVADEAAFGSYVAEHHPTEATAVLRLLPEDLPDALQALEFVGIELPDAPRVEVRPAWAGPFLAGLAVDVTEEADASAQVTRTVIAADTATGDVVPGIGVTRSEAKLVVSLDKGRRTAAITEARSTADAIVEAATEDDEAPDVDAAELDRRRVELEGMHADTLAVIAKGLGLGSSGTKAALAERIARIEVATGHTVRPASALAEAADVTVADLERIPTADGQGRIVEQLRDPHPIPVGDQRERDEARTIAERMHASPLPEGTEVEEVSTVEPDERTLPDPDGSNGIAPNVADYVDQPVEEVPDAGDVAEALSLDALQDEALADEARTLDRLRRNLDALSREVLRQHAKTLPGVSAAGTKAEVIDRLVAAGVTVSAVNETARKVRA